MTIKSIYFFYNLFWSKESSGTLVQVQVLVPEVLGQLKSQKTRMSGAKRIETSFYLGEIKYKTFEMMFFNEKLFKNYLFSEKF